MKVKTICFVVLIFLFSCDYGIDTATYLKFQKSGNAISGKVQTTLLSNVGKAIQRGGPQHAVEFCNLKAGSIVDSLNLVYNCTISRISEKNRNPENELSSAQEKELWRIFSKGTLADTLIKENKNLVFYKPIKTGMPACLKCHGDPESDINETTRQKLQVLYPNDLATGYKLNDFRGLWKIEFEQE